MANGSNYLRKVCCASVVVSDCNGEIQVEHCVPPTSRNIHSLPRALCSHNNRWGVGSGRFRGLSLTTATTPPPHTPTCVPDFLVCSHDNGWEGGIGPC